MFIDHGSRCFALHRSAMLIATLRSYRSAETLSSHCYKHIVPRGRRKLTRLVAIAIALSFVAMLPISSASSDKANTMACCVGKAAGHCDSGIPAKKIPPPEPMCGLDNSELEDDGITIVAEPSHNESHTSLSRTTETTSRAAEAISISKPCPMDCGACAASSARQHRRERGVLQPAAYRNAPITVLSEFDNLPFSWLANADLEQASPRGPPSHLL